MGDDALYDDDDINAELRVLEAIDAKASGQKDDVTVRDGSANTQTVKAQNEGLSDGLMPLANMVEVVTACDEDGEALSEDLQTHAEMVEAVNMQERCEGRINVEVVASDTNLDDPTRVSLYDEQPFPDLAELDASLRQLSGGECTVSISPNVRRSSFAKRHRLTPLNILSSPAGDTEGRESSPSVSQGAPKRIQGDISKRKAVLSM